MGDLEQDPRPIAGIGFKPGGAAVTEVQEDVEGVPDDPVILPPLDIDHKTDAAGVVLKSWVVEALFFWKTVHRAE